MLLCDFTNVYFEKNLHIRSRYIVQAGLLLLEQFCNYICLLFYMSIVTDPNISAYSIIGLNHPFIVGYGANILCHRVNMNR